MSTPSPAGDLAVVSLAMYPFETLRPAYEALWSHLRAAVVAELPDTAVPRHLDWQRSPTATWRDANLLLAQACGWPLVTQLPDVRVVGAFDVDVPGARAGTYRSVVVSRGEAFDELRRRGARAAVNDEHSLSGWVSLCAVWGCAPPPPVVTGSHRASVHAVATGVADVASIDAVTFAHLTELEPDVTGGLCVVAHGPRVPTLPLITSARHEPFVAVLRAALAELDGPRWTSVRDALRLRRFLAVGRDAYQPLLDLRVSLAPCR